MVSNYHIRFLWLKIKILVLSPNNGYISLNFLEIWKRCSSCLDLQKSQWRRPTSTSYQASNFARRGVFDVQNIWKSTSWLRLILPTYLLIFIEKSWVLIIVLKCRMNSGVCLLLFFYVFLFLSIIIKLKSY